MKKILFVEDNTHKRTRVIECINSIDPTIIVDEAWSFTSGCQKIQESQYDLLLLDISLPTFDRTSTDSGGRFRVFGGREIARKVLLHNFETTVAFITQFNAFSDKGNSYTFEALQEKVSSELKEKYLGMIYYNSSISTWRDELTKIVKGI